MKKAIFAIAALAILTVGNSFAQYGYSSKGHSGPGYSNSRNDNAMEEYQINKLDKIVKLSRKQENEIKRIENRYDKLLSNRRRPQTLQSIKRLEMQKKQEILSVLTPVQHQRLMAYERAQKFDLYNSRSSRRV
jgi:Zn-dependent M32 family carboxypeptidase